METFYIESKIKKKYIYNPILVIILKKEQYFLIKKSRQKFFVWIFQMTKTNG